MSDNEATRYPTGVRMDLIEPAFLTAMGQIMSVGAVKYGELNWRKGLQGEKGGVNHAYQHLGAYVANEPNDYGPREMHLAQVAINAMFEFYFERQRRLTNEAAEVEMDKKAIEKQKTGTVVAELFGNLSEEEQREFRRLAHLRKA